MSSLTQLLILVSLIDLNESASARDIGKNITQQNYLAVNPGKNEIAAAVENMKAAGHLSEIDEQIEIEYAAYGRLQELLVEVSSAALTPSGCLRIKEAAAYAAELYVEEEVWEQEIAHEKEVDKQRIEHERLLEEEMAQLHGYPYDILLQARETKRGRTKIYVILLDESVRQKRGVKLGSDLNQPAVYVGLTSLNPHQRFENHKANHKAGRGYARDYGICLLPHLYEAYNPMPRPLAVKAEKALADKLRLEGYTVLGGH